MNKYHFCQSCSMPIDDSLSRGTEKDGSLSNEYCHYCYRNGAFIVPDLTFDAMKSIVVDQMHKRHLPEDLIQKSIDILPQLKRWRKVTT